jgi:hypothetical protein
MFVQNQVQVSKKIKKPIKPRKLKKKIKKPNCEKKPIKPIRIFRKPNRIEINKKTEPKKPSQTKTKPIRNYKKKPKKTI